MPQHVTGLHHEASDAVWIAQRFRGPHRSGNGGYTAGVLAQRLLARSDADACLDRTVSVKLRLPPPLDASLNVSATGDDGIQAADAAGRVIAQAHLAAPLSAAPLPINEQAAAEASQAYRGRTGHPFPFCFSCGTDRDVGDALRLFAGPVPGHTNVTATPWQPDTCFSRAVLESDSGPTEQMIATPVIWAALDCPGAWAVDFDVGRPIVLGQMAAVVHHELTVGGRYVVVGQCRRQQGRKAFTATAIYDDHSRLMAAAEAIWLAIDPASFAGLMPA